LAAVDLVVEVPEAEAAVLEASAEAEVSEAVVLQEDGRILVSVLNFSVFKLK
jgi:hypothetical protein